MGTRRCECPDGRLLRRFQLQGQCPWPIAPHALLPPSEHIRTSSSSASYAYLVSELTIFKNACSFQMIYAASYGSEFSVVWRACCHIIAITHCSSELVIFTA